MNRKVNKTKTETMSNKNIEQYFTAIKDDFNRVDNRFDNIESTQEEHTNLLNQHTDMLKRIESLAYLTLEIIRHNDMRLKEMATKI